MMDSLNSNLPVQPAISPKNPQSGFTLLEILMVILLLFFISVTIFTTLRSMVNLKEQIDFQTEIFQGNRAVLGQWERDFQRIFFVRPYDLTWKPKKLSQQEQEEISASEDTPPDNDTGTLSTPQEPLPITLFQGTKDTVFFSTATHQRLYQNSPENEQHFVTYQILENNLVRAESGRAVSAKDRDDTDKYKRFTLIENVKRFELQYYDSKSQRWSDRWDSQNAETLDRVPGAIKINLIYQPAKPDGSRFEPKEQTLTTSFRLLEDVYRNVIKKVAATASEPTQPGTNPDAGGTQR
jgi:type II secretory pathway pseudopilin PulG